MARELTYPEVGATARGLAALPAGYHHLQVAREVGRGRAAYDVAVERVTSWQMHRDAGLRVLTDSRRTTVGAEATLLLGPGPLAVAAPVRVVHEVVERHRQGFAYGTLPGHPECGEESFVVELRADERVVAAITAFSRPATPLSRLAGPVGRALQRTITRRYLDAVLPR